MERTAQTITARGCSCGPAAAGPALDHEAGRVIAHYISAVAKEIAEGRHPMVDGRFARELAYDTRELIAAELDRMSHSAHAWLAERHEVAAPCTCRVCKITGAA